MCVHIICMFLNPEKQCPHALMHLFVKPSEPEFGDAVLYRCAILCIALTLVTIK